MKNVVKLFLMVNLLFVLLPALAQDSEVVVAYLPTYRNWPNSIYSTDLDIVTHINVAFENPDANGNIYMPNGIGTVVSVAHQSNVQVLISIAGAGANAQTYGAVLGDAGRRNAFIANLVQACRDYDLDGVDIDIEGDVLDGYNVTASMYEAFVVGLRNALQAEGKLMTAALGTWFLNRVTNTAAAQFDFINIMSYDAYGTWTGPGQHSSFQLAMDGFNDWRNKGVPANKLVIGVPFYGYGWGNYGTRAWTFNEIVSQFPGSENQNQVGSGNDVIYYNGIPLIKEKTEWAFENALGVMYWEETQDANGPLSLLQAIGEVKGVSGNTVSPNILTGKPVTVSSTDGTEHIAEHLNDRRLDTRWSSAYDNQEEWISFDLENTYFLDSLTIHWEVAYASRYDIQVSADGNPWQTIQSIQNTDDGADRVALSRSEARYLRIYGREKGTEWGYSIFEVQAFGTRKSTPYSGSPIAIPGRIEAEDFDNGGQNVAYFDTQAGNQFTAYREEDVDIEQASEGGYNIGAFESGEWTQYTLDVAATMNYQLSARIATEQSNTAFRLELDGSPILETVTVPNTGGWQQWSTVDLGSIELTAGEHVLRIISEQAYFNLNYLEVEANTVTAGAKPSSTSVLAIYPNPSADGVFHLTSTAPCIIYTPDGRMVAKTAAQNGTLNLSHLEKGLYVLKTEGTVQRIQIE